MKYRAVFFDAGETLVHPHPSFPELMSQSVTQAGVPLSVEAVTARFADISERFKQAARDNELWTTDVERSRAFWLSVYAMFLEGMDAPDDLPATLYEIFSDHNNYVLFEDVEPTLAALHAEGIDMGLISNFEEWLEILLERLDVTRYMPVRAISGIEGCEKPDVSLFAIALERARVTAADAVYVGDSPHFDVEPAAALGMYPVLLDRHDRFSDADAGPGVRIATLSTLAEALAHA